MKTLLPTNQAAPEIEEAYQAYLRFTMRAAQRKGHAKGIVESVFRTLTKRFQSISKSLEEQIHAITELECLEKLADFAYDCKTLDEFGESLK
ncbi:MAG: DUF4351 domain-containing protein [Planctomycetaceae bacterium]|nr:DUF4351 domain-containing protein [Planctomycetaceae bacterium]